jgi:hypothetical protein
MDTSAFLVTYLPRLPRSGESASFLLVDCAVLRNELAGIGQIHRNRVTSGISLSLNPEALGRKTNGGLSLYVTTLVLVA